MSTRDDLPVRRPPFFLRQCLRMGSLAAEPEAGMLLVHVTYGRSVLRERKLREVKIG